MSVLPFLFSHMSSLFSHVSSSWVHVEFKVCSQQVFCQKINYITWKTWPCTCAHDKWSYRTLAHSGYTYSCLIAYFPINLKKRKKNFSFKNFSVSWMWSSSLLEFQPPAYPHALTFEVPCCPNPVHFQWISDVWVLCFITDFAVEVFDSPLLV